MNPRVLCTLRQAAAMAAAVILCLSAATAHAASERALLRNLKAPTLALSKDPDSQRQLAEARKIASDSGKVSVIVGLAVPFAPEGDMRATDRRAQRSDIATARRALRAKLDKQGLASVTFRQTFASVPYVTLEVDAAGLAVLAQQPDVLSISVNRWNKPFLSESTGVVGAPSAWSSGYTGSGKVVAIIDTGVDKAHGFLAGKVVSEACFSGGGSSTYSYCPGQVTASTAPGSGAPCPSTGCDHGTHVAGIAAGSNGSFSGVAKGAGVIAIMAASGDGSFTGFADSDLMAALQHIFDLRSSYSIASVNMSLGGGFSSTFCDGSPLKPLIDNLRSANIATVIASGNDSYTNGVSSPGCISSAITVGATWDVPGQIIDCDSTASSVDRVACFSNSASMLDLLAPGIWINSSVPGGGYSVKAGTSMAAPHVAGAWAVLRQKFPSATVDQLLAAFSSTGKPVTDYRNGIVKPRINVGAAVNGLNTISFNAASYRVTEGVASVVLTVRRGNSAGQASVGYSTANGSAVAGSDYVATAKRVSFAAGATTAKITIPIRDNVTAEASETFRVNLSAPSSGYSLGGARTATVTILDNDPSFRLGAPAYATSEGKASVTIPVIRTRTTSSATVKFATANGTATSGSDFRGMPLTALSFPAGVASRNIVVPLRNDQTPEGLETFKVTLSSPSSGYGLIAPRTAVVTIRDDDSRFVVGAAGYSVSEATGTITIPVTRSRTQDQVSIGYSTVDGTAANGPDFAGTSSGSLTFAPGVATASITIPLVNDSTLEPDETFSVVIGPAPAGYVLGSPATATVTILNDDADTGPCSAGSISAALDDPNLSWASTTAAGWCTQSAVISGLSGGTAVQSGAIGNSSSSCIGTTTASGGTFNVVWGVDSEATYDFLHLYVDGAIVGSISGNSWYSATLTIPTSGSHTVQFCYSKDSSTAIGLDAGFVDGFVQTSSLSTASATGPKTPQLTSRSLLGKRPGAARLAATGLKN